MEKEKKIIFQELNGVTLVYACVDNITTFTCIPTSKKADLKQHRLFKDDWSQYFYVDPMIQVARVNDNVIRDFSAGETSYNSTTSFALKLKNQEVIEDDYKKEIRTYFETNDFFKAVHVVRQIKGYQAFEMWTEFENLGHKCQLERVSSFTIGSLSPLLDKNDPEKLILHTLQSYWSIEARKESTPLSKYNFEDSWSALGIKVHRIGSLGAMPSRNYNPFVALEDLINNVTWAVQLEAPSSWQIETIHKFGSVVLTGGQADFLHGHWKKTLNNKDIFITRKAYVSVVEGNLTAACAILTRYHDNLLHVPSSEESLPIVYNEYLCSWGKPTIDNIKPQLELAKDFNVKYFVIDAGWFCSINDDLLGDWNVVKEKFPNGLKEFSSYARTLDYQACGIWYEFEAATTNSSLYKNHPDWCAKLNNQIIIRDNRLLLDFRNQEVTDYLTQKVIKTLKDNNLNYIKIDYNENIGYGIDDEDSIGEGLRKHTENVINFMKKLTQEIPNLVVENCSSGGMRHEITYDTIGSMVSFSDAHEIQGGVVIAMDLHRIMQPRIMQIWASILPKLSYDEVYFTIAKAMLGRICISGQLLNVDKEILAILKEGVTFYESIKDVIKKGTTILIDTDEISSVLNPRGVCRLVRKSLDDNKIICYAFSFKDDRKISFNEFTNGYKLSNLFSNVKVGKDNEISFKKDEVSCAVLVFEKI